jgi:DNA polymerase-3 subunit gamma/tau
LATHVANITNTNQMSKVLYRKYRSLSLDELVGQKHITDTLKKAVDKNLISHAYLFTGPRGTGKTSVARILAHAVNGIAYSQDVTHIDIIEIDAASNRRIDEIRDLREKVHIAPTSLKYKVYIIDEVHMLTKEAFNALLKTLEEPPEHVIFILATTELQKVPDTIVSRTQRYTFKPIEKNDIVGHLRHIATSEKIEVDDEALEILAQHAEGGFRDAISMLDQARHSSDTVTAESVRNLLGIPSTDLIDALWSSLQSDTSDGLQLLQQAFEDGHHPHKVARALLKRALEYGDVARARQLLEVQKSPDPQTELILILAEQKHTKVTQAPTPKKQLIEKPELHQETRPVVEENSTTDLNSGGGTWEDVLQNIKESGHSVYGPLRLAISEQGTGTLRLLLKFPFHIKRINEPKNLQILKDTVHAVMGPHIHIEVAKLESTKNEPEAEKKTMKHVIDESADSELMSDPLSLVKNVFGSAEIL